MPDSDSESGSSSRRWFIYVIVAAGGVALRAGDKFLTQTDEVIRILREIEPRWLKVGRWSLKSYTGYNLATGERLQKQLDIPADNYVGIELDKRVDVNLSYRVTVESGPPIDIMLFGSEEYDKYIERDDATPIEDGSYLSVQSVDERVFLSPLNTHHLVIDNSPLGEAHPGGQTARVTFVVEMAPI